MPRHIDQTKIPKGAYWDGRRGTWYTVVLEGAKRSKKKLAGAEAKLSDLHRILEDIGGIQRDTLEWLCAQYHDSPKFKSLGAATQRSYAVQRQVIINYTLKTGVPLRTVRVAALTVPFVQRLIDKVAEDTPSMANHLHRYLRLLFAWGLRRGKCASNPAKGVEQAKERKRRRKVTTQVQGAMLAFAKTGAARKAHTEGSLSPYLWIAMELTYLCRLRGIEAITLTDAHGDEITGMTTNRRKGSRDSLVRWSPRLTEAWKSAQEIRKAIWARRQMPTPIRPEDRPLLVNQKGLPITRSGMDTIWQNFIKKAIEQKVITAEQRFGLHDLKRKATTDTKGREAKLEAGGWKEESMLDVYDLDVPEVDTPGGV